MDHLFCIGNCKIPVKVVIEMKATTRNGPIVDKYKQLFVASYSEEPDMNGLLNYCTKDVLQTLSSILY